ANLLQSSDLPITSSVTGDISAEIFANPVFWQRSGSNPETFLAPVGQSRPVTGKNVIIGIIDSGIDLGHKDFLKTTGCPAGMSECSRVLNYWNQTNNGSYCASPAPPCIAGEYRYGDDFSQSQINSMLS